MLRYLFIIAVIVVLPSCALIGQKQQVVEPEVKVVEKVVVKEVPAPCPVCPELKLQPVLEKTLECPSPKQDVSQIQPVKSLHHTSLPIIGEVEWVSVNAKRNRFKARIDTGAATSSIHAEDIQLFERDGRTWASFNIHPFKKSKPVRVKAPITRKSKIKQHDRASDERYVVELTLTMGDIKMKTEVNLNDRSEFRYPLLVGRSFLEGNVLVDTSQRYMVLD